MEAATDRKTKPASSPRVLIVGAGFAGIAAAAALRDGGIHDVIVLEAQDRPGGRVQKVPVDGGFVEIGAQFIHGEEGNALYDLAKKYNMLLDKNLYQTGKTSDSSAEDYRDHLFVTSKGEQVDREIATSLLKVANDMVHDYANSIFTSCTDDKGDNGVLPRQATFRDLMQMTHDKVMANDKGAEDVKIALLRWMYQWEYTDNGARLENLSLAAYGKYTYLPGFGLTLTSGGLEEVFQAFLQDSVPAEAFLLEKPVRSIKWGSKNQPKDAEHLMQDSNVDKVDEKITNKDEREVAASATSEHSSDFSSVDQPETIFFPTSNKKNPVKVVCEDGQVFKADHVIVTTSVGYLKKHQSTLFTPPLPADHQQAIREMGFDAVAKVMLVWDSLGGALSTEYDGVQFLWLTEHPPTVHSSKTSLRTKDGRNWYDNLQGFERILGHEGVLLTWLAGEEAEIMEALPEQEVTDVLHELLVLFTNNPGLPRPKQLVRSQWHSNPYILGAYSYIAAGVEEASHALLTVPVPSAENPLVCLAGEATSQSFYSTVHGAIGSGQRAARAILTHYGLMASADPNGASSENENN